MICKLIRRSPQSFITDIVTGSQNMKYKYGQINKLMFTYLTIHK